jgi:cytochrome c553
MLRSLVPIALVAVVAVLPFGARADSKLALKSISVDLPAGEAMFPSGPHADTVNADCLACHSAGMVLNQPALSRTEWQAEVDKMRMTYKAPIEAKDVALIVDYLMSIRGKE